MTAIFQNTSSRQNLVIRLNAIQAYVGQKYLPANFEDELNLIRDFDDLVKISHDTQSLLWWFVGPISYELFKPNGERNSSILIDDHLRNTIAILPPPFVSDSVQAKREIKTLGCEVLERKICFSQLLVCLLYGAYPWFDSYYQICKELSIFNKDAVILDIELPENLSPSMLNKQKDRIRNQLSPEITMNIKGAEFPGKLRPIHIPDSLEIARHAKATRL
ncbi:hypothetical protein [Undibacterium curvum]|uniref:Uncharacterized protein n=1 Tax=Undibacterium curvum TaxID=2762294 RepID=A0ABR7A111_9BURK|nr:hypothetical protein [Undibacterium curvum]MBC3930593.1 hypothetical protein [Undibacterium curvum]